MSKETQVVAQEPGSAASAPNVPGSGAADPFALDENAFVSLTPEQRAGLDPILDTWKKKAHEEISRRESEHTEKYKPYEDKANTLDKLAKYQPFVQWWQSQQNAAKQGATGHQQDQIDKASPFQVASAQEWQEAVLDMSNGDPTKFNALQQKSVLALAQPFVQQVTGSYQRIQTELNLERLFKTHPDAVELDKIGLDEKTKEGISLLEMGLDWAEKNGKSMDEGYALAKKWADQLSVTAQQKAMGMVQDKKASVTAGPSSAGSGKPVIEVNDFSDLLTQELKAQVSGNKDARFVIKGSR